MFLAMTPDVIPLLKTIPFLRDVPDRAVRAAAADARWFSLPAGQPLFLGGEAADSIYFVLSGTLGTFRIGPSGSADFVGHVRSGEPVGEMALFVGGVDLDGDGTIDDALHTSSVYALRDSEIIGLTRKGWQRLVKSAPELLESMIRVILRRLGRSGERNARAAPKVYTLLATSPTIDLMLRARVLKDALKRFGLRARIVAEAEGDDKPSAFFDALEQANDILILIASIGDTSWYRLAIRQADRIWVLARADARPSDPLMPEDPSPARALKLVDVLLLHHGGTRQAARPEAWMSAAGASRLFHWRGDQGPYCDRLARVMVGRSVGVVMSGGGARAYSHIGTVRAMRELGIPIDLVGGASMGAVIAACVAMGWDDAEIDMRIRKAFVESNPLGDYNLPVVGMVKGQRVNARLKEHFGEMEISDLQIPFFAASTNLTTGAMRLHRSGLLRAALRATISLPGILPPVVDGKDILVDGAVLNNFPIDVMREMHLGFVVGSDVSRQPAGLRVEEFAEPQGFFRWVSRHGFSAPPPIASLLMRAATIRSQAIFGHDIADVLVLPELPAVDLRDWTDYDASVEAGYVAAKKAFEGSEVATLCCPK